MILRTILLITFISIALCSQAQFTPSIDTDRPQRELPVQQDSLEQENTYKKKTIGSQKIFYGEPGKAALYSLIIPSGGQFYNKRWWKAPLVWGLEGTAVYYLIQNRNNYTKWNNCYIGLLNNGSVEVDETLRGFCSTNTRIITTPTEVFDIRNGFRKNRELSYIFLGAAHLLQVVEAFVDRHLINFDVSDDLSFMKPTQTNPIGYDATQVTLVSLSISLN